MNEFAAAQQDWQAAKAAKASTAAAMQAAFPHLVPVSAKVDNLQAAAKNIRRELGRAFPGITFSVKSKRYSGGNSIDVYWTDGPNGHQVDVIINKYSAGNFDGMTDSYTYNGDAWNDAFGETKYVHSTRHDSDNAIESAIRTVRTKYTGNFTKFGIESVSIDDYRHNRLWSVDLLGAGSRGCYDLQSLISTELQRRTWAIDQTERTAIR